MSRRPPTPPVGRVDRARARMAPGGRMWSESPLRYPRKRTATSGVPADSVAPVWCITGHVSASSGVITLPEFGEATSAVAFITSRGSSIPTAPAGWTVLASGQQTGAWSGQASWAAIKLDSIAGGEDREVLVDDTNNSSRYAYFGGQTGGHWAWNSGTEYNSVSLAGYAAPPPGSQVFWMAGFMSNRWILDNNPQSCVYDGDEFISCYAKNNGTYSGTAFEDDFTGETWLVDADGLLDFTALGAYGHFGSLAGCFGWTP